MRFIIRLKVFENEHIFPPLTGYSEWNNFDRKSYYRVTMPSINWYLREKDLYQAI